MGHRVIAFNGSPRREGNSATLLGHALRGAADAGAETELVHLYSVDFRGCSSCFACKRKGRVPGTCAMRDGLTPVLERIRQADALILGGPIYFMNMSSGMMAFLERLCFPYYNYSREEQSLFPGRMATGLIYTMNITRKEADRFLRERLMLDSLFLRKMFRVKPKILCSCNTCQFDDYSQYEVSMYSGKEKAAYRAEHFPKDEEAAYAMGRSLAVGEP